MHALLLLITLIMAAPPNARSSAPLDSARIERLTGAHGRWFRGEGVFKVTAPREDIDLSMVGMEMTPALGVASWAAFTRDGDHAMVMADLCLLEEQVNRVMSTALDNGLEVTALHNHFLWESPKLMFMHVAGMGDEARLAAAIGKVFARMREPVNRERDVPLQDMDPKWTTLAPAKIEAILREKGTLADGVYKVTVGHTVRMHGMELGAAMGMNSWAAFVGSDERAVAEGDLAIPETHLQPVLRILRKAGIYVAAIHQHMEGEEPRTIFVHYWGQSSTQRLATALRAALDAADWSGTRR